MIGKKIRKWRVSRDYSQSYLAYRLGIDQSTYSRIENGRCQPNLDRLERIADILEVPLEALLRTEPPAPSGLAQVPAAQTALAEKLLAENAERARELERLNHRLMDMLERRRDGQGA